MKTLVDIAGQRFCRLTVMFRARNHRGKFRWLCLCDCGKTVFADGYTLLHNQIKSCGCCPPKHNPHPANRPTSSRPPRIKHGHSVGKHMSPEYQTWSAMISRCYNPARQTYHLYGGRGITVCERWRKDFAAFFADTGPRPSPKHSIDRIDNDGNYEPGNCQWATPHQQTRNTRRNIWLTYDGLTLCVADWATRLGISPKVIYGRLRRGATTADALRA